MSAEVAADQETADFIRFLGRWLADVADGRPERSPEDLEEPETAS